MPIRCDLRQIFMNLLNNSAKYTERGGRIELSAHVEGSDVVVAVKDNGIGIPAGMLAHVFDMFTQIDPSLDRAQGGLGIGLTLVKRLVEMHGGAIELRSAGPDTAVPLSCDCRNRFCGAANEAAQRVLRDGAGAAAAGPWRSTTTAIWCAAWRCY